MQNVTEYTTITRPSLPNPEMAAWYEAQQAQRLGSDVPMWPNFRDISTLWKVAGLIFASWAALGAGTVLALICILAGAHWMFASLVVAVWMAGVIYPVGKLLSL